MDSTLRHALIRAIEPGSLLLVVHGSDHQPTEISPVPPGSLAAIDPPDDASLLVAALLHLTSRVQALEVEAAATRRT